MNGELLKQHFHRWPLMQPQDAVKLAYQSAFGCGHMLPSEERCTGMIEQELAQTPEGDIPAAEFIGNGLCRLNLAAPAVRRIGAKMIWRMMCATDRQVSSRKNNRGRYEEAVRLLRKLAEAQEAPFRAEALEAYLEAYQAQGLRAVSHTGVYRDAYQPAYRVVLADCALLLPVLWQIRQGRKLIVMDGPCGSGKTTLAALLAQLCGTQPVPMDDFFLPPAMRTPERLGEPGGNVHYERFAQEVIECLKQGGDVRWQRFDCSTFEMHERSLPASEVTVIEGSYSHHPAFAQSWRELNALRVFVQVDQAEQLRRIEKRDPELLSMFQTRWIPLEKNYFEAYDIKGGADVIIHSPSDESREER